MGEARPLEEHTPICSCLRHLAEKSHEAHTRHYRDHESGADVRVLSAGAADRAPDLPWQLCRIYPGSWHPRPVAPVRVQSMGWVLCEARPMIVS